MNERRAAETVSEPTRRRVCRDCMDGLHELCEGVAAVYAHGAAYTDPPLTSGPCGCRVSHPQLGGQR